MEAVGAGGGRISGLTAKVFGRNGAIARRQLSVTAQETFRRRRDATNTDTTAAAAATVGAADAADADTVGVTVGVAVTPTATVTVSITATVTVTATVTATVCTIIDTAPICTVPFTAAVTARNLRQRRNRWWWWRRRRQGVVKSRRSPGSCVRTLQNGGERVANGPAKGWLWLLVAVTVEGAHIVIGVAAAATTVSLVKLLTSNESRRYDLQ